MKIKIEVMADNANESSILDKGLEAVLRVVAGNPNAPEQLLGAVTDSTSPAVRAEIAGNPNATLSMLDKLVEDDDRHVRAALAQHELAIHYCWKLICDPDPLVRYCLAMNPNLPEHVYVTLTNDDNERVARRARRSLSKLASENNPIGQIFERFSRRRAS